MPGSKHCRQQGDIAVPRGDHVRRNDTRVPELVSMEFLDEWVGVAKRVTG